MSGRIRSIKPEILDDEKSAGLSPGAWRLWVSMWLLADDYGRLRGGAAWLRAQVFWATSVRDQDVAGFLEDLARVSLIIRYTADGQSYIAIRNWNRHQRVDHPGKPRIPAPPENGFGNLTSLSRESLATHSESLAPDLDLRPPTNDQPTNEHADSLGLVGWHDELFEKYPRKTSANKRRAAMALAQLTNDEKATFTKALAAYAQSVRVENTPSQYMITWAVFCEGRWREHVPHVTKATAGATAPNVYDLDADPPPTKEPA